MLLGMYKQPTEAFELKSLEFLTRPPLRLIKFAKCAHTLGSTRDVNERKRDVPEKEGHNEPRLLNEPRFLKALWAARSSGVL
jgi:hypothetical protein